MTVVCPNGHPSTTEDYCDTCGAPIASGEAARPQPAPPSVEPRAPQAQAIVDEEEDTSPALIQAPCPACGAPRSGDDRYCEACGHDFLAPPSTGLVWEAVATADPEQFERLAVAGISFPDNATERRFVLESSEVRIGRSRDRAGEVIPEIDLSGPSEDPGISQLHAILERQADGSYTVRDLGSTNGTTVNGAPVPTGENGAVPLADGDRIGLGAWTTITVHSR